MELEILKIMNIIKVIFKLLKNDVMEYQKKNKNHYKNDSYCHIIKS